MINYELLKRLCLAQGVSGDESAVREIIINEIKDYADYQIDSLGNILVHKKGKNPAKSRLMLSAHMDEVGLMVTDVISDGFLKFDEIGGIDRRVLLGKSVTVGKNKVHGVIGVKPIHLSKGDEAQTIPEMSDMYIDIGADSEEEALAAVSLGDSVFYNCEFLENEDTINAKAIDDRFGCCVLIALIQSELAYDADFAFVVQEEVGLRGARVAAYTLEPDFALVIETTTSAEIPEVDKTKQVCNLGEGAVISLMDRHTIYDKEMISLAFSAAGEIGVKAQTKRAVAGGNDAGAIHQSRGGVRTLAVSLACRYLHAPSTVASKKDCESVLALAKALAEKIAGGALAK